MAYQALNAWLLLLSVSSILGMISKASLQIRPKVKRRGHDEMKLRNHTSTVYVPVNA